MESENPLLLAIDDKGTRGEGRVWVDLGEKYDVPCKLVLGDTKEEILGKLQKMFSDDSNLMFVGTILDIIYVGQTQGGIGLWEELEASGLAERCGELLVTTKQDSEEVIEFVESRGAMLNTKPTPKQKEPVFKRFLRKCGLL